MGVVIDDEWSTTRILKRISYLSIPISYKRRFGKMEGKVGVLALVKLDSYGQAYTQVPYEGDTLIFETEGELGIVNLDVGPKVGLSYTLNSKLSIELSYYYGINDILAGESQWIWATQFCNIVIPYTHQ